MLITYSLSNRVITINMKNKQKNLHSMLLFCFPLLQKLILHTYMYVCICISGSCIVNEDNHFPSQTLTITTLIMILHAQVMHSFSPTNQCQWERWKTVQATAKLGLN